MFWNDPEAEFLDALPLLQLPDVQTLRLDEMAALEVKIRLEKDDPSGRYLLYAPAAPPPEAEDWLLDIRLYSGAFYADLASLWLNELGLGNSQTLRPHLNERRKFLASRDRLVRLQRLVAASDSATDLDRKMLAVAIACETAEPFTVGAALFGDLAAQEDGLNADSPAWGEIEKFGLAPVWWEIAADLWGYREEAPSLRRLLLRLLVTDLAHTTGAKLPASVRHHLLPVTGWSNVAVFLNQWRDSLARGAAYDALALDAAKALDIEPILRKLPLDALERAHTFQEVEKALIAGWRDRIVQEGERLDIAALQTVVTSRLDGHFTTNARQSSAIVPREAYVAAYRALLSAAELLVLVAKYRDGFAFGEPDAAFARYCNELFRVDQLYRHFCETAAIVRAQSWDLLKSLSHAIEDAYGTGYLGRLGAEWSAMVEAKMLPNWRLDEMPNQFRFFENQVAAVLGKGDVKRVYVVISDALRYEIAHELAAHINGQFRFRARLSAQLGVVPSYTALGMAALLPHQRLSYRENGEILADGKSTAGLENRRAILARQSGVAIGADELQRMNRDEGRDFVREAKVVYIYHDTIDAVGDKAATEDEVFQAARRAIEELAALANAIINKFNGSTIFLTADHGFLYEESVPETTDKSKLDLKPMGTVIAKKRYLLGHGLGTDSSVHAGNTRDAARAGSETEFPMEFWVPRSTNRFHFAGGARYFHGGVMPQEVIVPILAIREAEGKAALGTRTRPVRVHILDAPRITTNKGRFELLQTEAVTDRIKALTVQIGIYEGETLVSELQTITFESRSEDKNTHQKTVLLSLQSRPYDRNGRYSVVLRNAEDGVEIERREVAIDRAFREDF